MDTYLDVIRRSSLVIQATIVFQDPIKSSGKNKIIENVIFVDNTFSQLNCYTLPNLEVCLECLEVTNKKAILITQSDE